LGEERLGGVGPEKGDAGDALLLGEVDGLLDEFGGEVEGHDPAIPLVPEPDGHASGAAARLNQAEGLVGKIPLDQDEF
jgi:hypothetical protein